MRGGGDRRAACLWRRISIEFQRISPESRKIPAAADDARLKKLRQAIQVLLSERGNRAEQVQMIFSDTATSYEVCL
jgi:hypothetical protein